MFLLYDRWGLDRWRERRRGTRLASWPSLHAAHTLKQAARPGAIISTILLLEPRLIPTSLLGYRDNPYRLQDNVLAYDSVVPAAIEEAGNIASYAARDRRLGG